VEVIEIPRTDRGPRCSATSMITGGWVTVSRRLWMPGRERGNRISTTLPRMERTLPFPFSASLTCRPASVVFIFLSTPDVFGVPERANPESDDLPPTGKGETTYPGKRALEAL